MRHSLSLLALFTSSAFAAVDGTNVNWSNYTDMVNNNCTGTVIGGNKIITAAHCHDISVSVNTQNGSWINPTNVELPYDYYSGDPLAVPNNDFDIAILTLPTRVETHNVHFFANLNTDPVRNAEHINMFGFAGSFNELSYATMVINSAPTGIRPTTRYVAEQITNGGHTKGGDSGGAWLNANNEIVAIHNASTILDSDGSVPDYTYGINLHESKDFLLATVDSWHYPTLATIDGTQAITVQSLHTGGVADSAYPEGNVTITGGTCSGNNAIGEFEKCTYEIEATGEGKLWLTANEYIHINKPAPSTDNGGGGSSGGSMSLFGLLGLFGLGVARMRNRK